MSSKNTVELGSRSWNPLRGCSRVSDGCQNCYAERFAYRLSETGQPYEGLVKMTRNGPRWTGKIRLVPELLRAPFRWRKSCMVFVNSMSDLFHKDVPDQFISDIFDVMRECYWHTFFIITKRPQRMRDWIEDWRNRRFNFSTPGPVQETPRNVWLGISVENQIAADDRIPIMLETPAPVRFLCCEPLLGPVDLSKYLGIKWNANKRSWIDDRDSNQCKDKSDINWVIVGAESGYGARGMNDDWVRTLRDQCVSAKVLFYFKQRTVSGSKTGEPELDGLRWEQMPEVEIYEKAGKKPQPGNCEQLEFNFGD
jgi:protein gp37